MTKPDGAFPSLRHLWRLTDLQGVIEHARGTLPAREHGYCVDDVARALVLLCRRNVNNPREAQMTDLYLRFVLSAIGEDGAAHNRMSCDGVWRDEPSTDDCWGRAVWALGFAASTSARPQVRELAARGFKQAARARSEWLHSCSFALLGASRVLQAESSNRAAHALVQSCSELTAKSVKPSDSAWPWPEPRLRYANGAIAEGLLLAGVSLHDPKLSRLGLTLLAFLLRTCEGDVNISLPPAAGRGPGAWDAGENQQPIEAAAIADACMTAYFLTDDVYWRTCVYKCWRWFLGENDWNTCMVDWTSHGSYDGLSRTGPNLNQGAESTLAMLSTAQCVRELEM